MSDTHQWNIEIGGTIGTLLDSSEFYTGPFPPNTNQDVAKVDFRCDVAYGCVNVKLHEYPGQPEEQIIDGMSLCGDPNPPGEFHTYIFNELIPSEVAIWPLGVKVWGQSEPEPEWGTMGAHIFGAKTFAIPPFVIPAVALVALLGISYYLLKK